VAHPTDVLNAELVATGAEADRAMADERMRASRLSTQVEALSAEVMRADAARRDKERADADRGAERARADALQGRIEALEQRGGVDVTEVIRQAEAMVDSLREAQAGKVSALKAKRHRLATQIDGFAVRADQAIRPRLAAIHCALGSMSCRVNGTLHASRPSEKARGLVARLRAVWWGE
jgi:hypothetical protein